jgi:hypothetical protein
MAEREPAPDARDPAPTPPDRRPLGWLWPHVSSVPGAVLASRYGFWAVAVLAGLYLIWFALLAVGLLAGLPRIGDIEQGDTTLRLMSFSGVFGAAAAVVAYGYWRHSPVAAIAALCLGGVWLIHEASERLADWSGLNWTLAPELLVLAVFYFLCLHGVRGAFAYQRLRRNP